MTAQGTAWWIILTLGHIIELNFHKFVLFRYITSKEIFLYSQGIMPSNLVIRLRFCPSSMLSIYINFETTKPVAFQSTQ